VGQISKDPISKKENRRKVRRQGNPVLKRGRVTHFWGGSERDGKSLFRKRQPSGAGGGGVKTGVGQDDG